MLKNMYIYHSITTELINYYSLIKSNQIEIVTMWFILKNAKECIYIL